MGKNVGIPYVSCLNLYQINKWVPTCYHNVFEVVRSDTFNKYVIHNY